MRIAVLALFLTACGDAPALIDLLPSSTHDAAESPSEPGRGSAGGTLPPGFYQRGCQWDNPACGPTPGTKPEPALDPER